ncbi:MAG TPA: hypothetical protein VFH68_01090 [Polyangia bacterium]|nr:hypothetical protein [Polyangia bacterium]
MSLNDRRRRARSASATASASSSSSSSSILAGLLALGLLARAAPARAWDPIKSAGQDLAAGVRTELEPLLASTIADVDRRAAALTTQVVNQASLAGGDLIGKANKAAAERLDQTQNIIEKQILNVEVSARGVVGDALGQVDDIARERLKQAGKLVDKTVGQLDKTVSQSLNRVDEILQARTRDLATVVDQTLDHADQVLEQRIQQIDEVAGRRLANIDVIATKQRLGIEETLVRVAVLVGLLVFVVFVVIRLWREYETLSPQLTDRRGLAYLTMLSGRLGRPLARQIAAAALLVGVFAVLYQRLPFGGTAEATGLATRHATQLAENLAHLEYTQVRFHASQLEMLLPAQADRYRGIAAKADLLEQVLGRPTLLTTPQGIRTAMDKASEVERLFAPEVDADVLAVKCLISWRVGTSRRDEHEAVSLCARAVRVGRAGFALQPLAIDVLRAFLHAPYLAPGTPLGRDAESLPDLEAALAAAGEPRRGFPFERALALAELVRGLDRASSRAYVRMIEAQADVVRLTRTPAQPRSDPGAPRTLDEARATRTKWAKELLAAWKAFDAALQAIPGLNGSPEVLAIFRLNDAVWPRALWFVDQPNGNDLAPAFADLPSSRADSTALKILLAPPRVAWARRYAALLAGPARTLVELQEAARYRAYEKAAQSFEKALVALLSGAGDAALARRQAVLGAARLGLFVDGGVGGRLPYALEILRRSPAPRSEFEEALSSRAPYLASLAASPAGQGSGP